METGTPRRWPRAGCSRNWAQTCPPGTHPADCSNSFPPALKSTAGDMAAAAESSHLFHLERIIFLRWMSGGGNRVQSLQVMSRNMRGWRHSSFPVRPKSRGLYWRTCPQYPGRICSGVLTRSRGGDTHLELWLWLVFLLETKN